MTLISFSPFKPQLKEKEREYKLKNNDNPVIFFTNLKHNNSQSQEYKHRMINYVKSKILNNKSLNYINKDSWFLLLKL
jgi:hypothetical protein